VVAVGHSRYDFLAWDSECHLWGW